jgi:hypothetical protein
MPTISGNIKHPTLSGSTQGAVFELVSVPSVVSSSIITGRKVSVTPDSSGDFSTTLATGEYRFYPDRDDDRYLLLGVGTDDADVADLVDVDVTEGATSFRMKNYDTGAWVTIRVRDAGGVSTFEVI